MLLLVRSLSYLCQISPNWLLKFYCFFLGGILYYALPSKRMMLLSQLAHVYPQKSLGQLRRLGRINCRRTIEMGLLALISPRYTADSIKEHLIISEDTKKRISENALKEPLLILLPHSYLLELFACVPTLCDLRPGQSGAIFRPMDHPALDAWIQKSRERWGCQLFSRKEKIHHASTLLRNGGLLAILADQHAGASGVMGHFAGRIASYSPLPDILVKRIQPRVAFAYVERTKFLTGRFHFELAPEDDRCATAKFGAWWENKLLTHPGMDCDWLWLHRRWKIRDRPRERLQLNPKRSWPEGPIPPNKDRRRADRIDLRLPESKNETLPILPLLNALRTARPDARLTAICNPEIAALLDAHNIQFDHVFIVDRNKKPLWRKFWQRRIQFTDTTILFTKDLRSDFEIWLTGSRQRFGATEKRYSRPLLTHHWKAPKSKDSTLPHDTAYWQDFLSHFGMRESP